MNRMARYQLLRNRGNDDADAAFRRLAMFHRQHAQDANPRGNDLDLMMVPFANVGLRAAREGVREARCERVTVRGNVLRYVTYLTLPYLAFGVGKLLHLPSAEAVSIQPNAQLQCKWL